MNFTPVGAVNFYLPLSLLSVLLSSSRSFLSLPPLLRSLDRLRVMFARRSPTGFRQLKAPSGALCCNGSNRDRLYPPAGSPPPAAPYLPRPGCRESAHRECYDVVNVIYRLLNRGLRWFIRVALWYALPWSLTRVEASNARGTIPPIIARSPSITHCKFAYQYVAWLASGPRVFPRQSMAVLLDSKIQRPSERLDARKRIKLLVSARADRYVYKARSSLESRPSPFFFSAFRWLCWKKPMNFDVELLKPAWRGCAAKMEDPRTSHRMFPGKIAPGDCRCREWNKKASSLPGTSIHERQRRARARARGGKRKGGAVYVFHTGMHGAHQFSVKPINLPRVLSENEPFDGWRTRPRCSRHAALFRAMTKNRRDVHVNRKSLSPEEINALLVCNIDSNSPITKWDRW